MRKCIITGSAVTLSLAFAGAAQADTVSTTFDSFALGSVNGQNGWLATNPNVDQEIVDVNGHKKLRVSNAFTSGSFGDMPHSKPVLKPAGENEATNVLVNEFTLQAPENFVPGLAVTFSPDEGQGSRMSRVRFEDRADGVHVLFADATFVDQDIATLDRTVAHQVRIETTFVHGHDNDVVRVIIDGDQKVRGGSWENYYREFEERNPSASDRLLIRTAGTAAPLTEDNGFLIDDVTTSSYHVSNPAPLHPVVIPVGPQGPAGENGKDGINGVDGAPGATGAAGHNGADGGNGHDGADGIAAAGASGPAPGNGITTATLRTLRAPTFKGMKFVSVRASLRGKHLSVNGRKIKVDLRGKSAGNYNVSLVAKYKTKSGKLRVVRIMRNLSVHTA